MNSIIKAPLNAIVGTAKVVSNFAEDKKQSAIIQVENSTALGILLKWLMTNWVTVFITIILGGYYISSYIEADKLKDMLWKQQVEDLNIDLAELKENKERLKVEIDKLAKDKKNFEKENKKLVLELEKLNSSELKVKLLDYTARLKTKRNME